MLNLEGQVGARMLWLICKSIGAKDGTIGAFNLGPGEMSLGHWRCSFKGDYGTPDSRIAATWLLMNWLIWTHASAKLYMAFARTMRLLRFGLDSAGPRVKINLFTL